jgi:hypothetical protein
MAPTFIQNFPFRTLRKSQDYVLKEIDSAFKSGYKYILLEAPTGIGKSGIAISVARALGTSYICTSTKDLQTQYARDFPFLRVVKGKNNFICAVKEDFIKDGRGFRTFQTKSEKFNIGMVLGGLIYSFCKIDLSYLNFRGRYIETCKCKSTYVGRGIGMFIL